MKNGLKPETDVAFIVSRLWSEDSIPIANLAKGSDDIGNVAAGVFRVRSFSISPWRRRPSN